MRQVFRTARSFVTSLYFLLFVYGFLVAAFVICLLQDSYENNVFAQIAKHVSGYNTTPISADAQIKKALNTTWYLLHSRSDIFNNASSHDLIDELIDPLSSDLITAQGACGSYSTILCRTLNTMGIETRFAQMKVGKIYGGHIVIEAKTPHGWAVLDPLYNLQFINPQGQTASFDEVAANWPRYKQQVPPEYDLKYCYEGVRYTNWNKIPVIMPALKKTLSLFMNPVQLQHLSLRTYFLRKYKIMANVLLAVIVLVTCIIIKRSLSYGWKGPANWRLINKETFGHAGHHPSNAQPNPAG